MPATHASNNGTKVPVIFMIMTGTLLSMAFGAGWTLMQNQFANVDKAIEARDRLYQAFEKSIIATTAENRATGIANGNRLSQELKDLTDEFHNEMRHNLVGQAEFKQFEARQDSVLRRLDVVETTRPTTGELKGTADGLSRSVDVLAARFTQIETRAFDSARTSARNPIEASEINAIIGAINKQMDVVQKQIEDLNRQVAAALVELSQVPAKKGEPGSK